MSHDVTPLLWLSNGLASPIIKPHTCKPEGVKAPCELARASHSDLSPLLPLLSSPSHTSLLSGHGAHVSACHLRAFARDVLSPLRVFSENFTMLVLSCPPGLNLMAHPQGAFPDPQAKSAHLPTVTFHRQHPFFKCFSKFEIIVCMYNVMCCLLPGECQFQNRRGLICNTHRCLISTVFTMAPRTWKGLHKHLIHGWMKE